MKKDSAQTVHVVANVCALLAHGILIAMVSPSIRSCDCACPFMNWFPWAHTFLWAPFLNIFTSHFRIRLFHIEKSVEKSRSNCLYLMCNIWCAVCGSVWTKNQIDIHTFSKAIANVQQQKHVSIYIVPVLNYMCWRMQRYTTAQHFSLSLYARPVCVPVHANANGEWT